MPIYDDEDDISHDSEEMRKRRKERHGIVDDQINETLNRDAKDLINKPARGTPDFIRRIQESSGFKRKSK